MEKCFMIQPFDQGPFDKRYDDVFEPAIREAGFEPYRVDQDPGVTIPIDDIAAGIQSCGACLAEITTNNPNVWYELGYAIASQQEVVLVCSDGRNENFPFDVRHRSIIKYKTESSQDFERLRTQIVEKLKALQQKKAQLDQVAQLSPVAKFEGLEQHEIGTLIAVAEWINDPDDSVRPERIREDMRRAGFTNLAATLGLNALRKKKMLESFSDTDSYGNRFTAYRMTDRGMDWLLENQDKLTLRQGPPLPDDDDVPF